MNFEVAVPQDNYKVWHKGQDIQLTAEALSWLEDRVGARCFMPPGHLRDGLFVAARPYWLILNNWHSIKRSEPTKIFFSHGDHAMLFKLVFL